MKRILFVLFSGVLFYAQYLDAERIYRSVGADGTISYSSEQPIPGLKPVELPDIQKKKMPAPQVVPQSCREHGGTNCQVGPDADGSVVCYDGYRKSPARYNEHCDGTRIQVTHVSRREKDGAFIVTIRNSRSVVAKSVRIVWKNDVEEIALLGAPTIGAFGVEEYILLFDHQPFARRPLAVKNEDFRLHCDNCQWRSEELEINKAAKAQAEQAEQAERGGPDPQENIIISPSSTVFPQISPKAEIKA